MACDPQKTCSKLWPSRTGNDWIRYDITLPSHFDHMTFPFNTITQHRLSILSYIIPSQSHHTYMFVVSSSCSHTKRGDSVLNVLRDMTESFYEPTVVFCNALLDGALFIGDTKVTHTLSSHLTNTPYHHTLS